MSDETRENELGLTFPEWLKQYNAAVYTLCSMSADDLPDLIFTYDRWEACEDPSETAQELVEQCLGELGMSLEDITQEDDTDV